MYHVLIFSETTNDIEKMLEKHYQHYFCLIGVKTIQSAIDELRNKEYVLIVLAADYLKDNLLSMIKTIRDISSVPILVVTSEYHARTQAITIKSGADMYITAPSTLHEFMMIGYALIRRYTELNYINVKPTSAIIYWDILLLPEHRKAFIGNSEVKLTRNDFEVLRLLILKPGRVFTHEEIYSHVYSGRFDTENVKAAVKSQIKRLRKSIKKVVSNVEYIESVRGVGYRSGIVDKMHE